MTDRLDRIEALLENTAERQAKHTDEIDTLLAACSTNEAAIRNLTVNVSELRGESADTQKRFEILRDEAKTDRLETREMWNDAVAQMKTDREESSRRFDAQQEIIQRLLIELVEMNRDNRRLRDRFDTLEQAS